MSISVHKHNKGFEIFMHILVIFMALFWWPLVLAFIKASSYKAPILTLAANASALSDNPGIGGCLKEVDSINTVIVFDNQLPSGHAQTVVTTEIKDNGNFKNERRIVSFTQSAEYELPVRAIAQKGQRTLTDTYDYIFEFNEETCAWDPYELQFSTNH